MTETASRNAVEALVLNFRPRFEGALANKPVSFEPFLAAVMSDAVRQPMLMQCARANPTSLMECLMVCANAGLLPGSAHDQFFLIPRDGKQGPEVTFIVGYKGLTAMAYRHPRVHSIEAFCVYEGEAFSFDPGNGIVKHSYRMDVDRSDAKIVAAWAKATLTIPNGTHIASKPVCWVMTRKEIDAIMARSPAARRGFSPWKTDYAAMARKTPLRALLNHGSVPRQQELAPLLTAERDQEERFVQVDAAESGPRAATKTDEILGKLGAPAPDGQDWSRNVMSGFVEEALSLVPEVPIVDLERLRGLYGNLEGDDAEQLDRAIRERKETGK